MPTLTRDGEVAVLNIGNDENRFSPEWLEAMHRCLDDVESRSGPAALVTVADGKFWSNGLDLDWLMSHTDQGEWYVDTVQRLLSRVLSLGMPTVAAIQGHCFAAGGMLAMAHDWRVMRADRGFFCLPEVDLDLPFPPGMDALLRAKLSPATAMESMTTGRRYGGNDALAAGIVTAAVAESEVRSAALDLVRPLTGKAGPNLGVIKSTMFGEAIRLLAVVHRPKAAG
ncbi:MAG TPA: enoyl-CoA hydratase-related protein [Mycobacteriales bacterium]|nr:enoyl-CoA hydratase-related protein [Mycobacteriales bacterium]HWA66420.1 enoyl-CoA hydratase-related protein [Mycobacteriales bacterium]